LHFKRNEEGIVLKLKVESLIVRFQAAAHPRGNDIGGWMSEPMVEGKRKCLKTQGKK
jgi:hypothetical protein